MYLNETLGYRHFHQTLYALLVIFFFIFALSPQTSTASSPCDANYRYEVDSTNKTVTFISQTNRDQVPRTVASADVDSFVAFLSEGKDTVNCTYNSYSAYARDKNNVYHEDKIVIGADPKTFVLLNAMYGRDKDHVYADGVLLSDADVSTFAPYSIINGQKGYYYKDKNWVYGAGVAIDPSGFVLLSPEKNEYIPVYAKNTSSVYYGIQIAGADVATFELVDRANEEEAKDKNRVYRGNAVLVGIDPVSYVQLGCGYWKDKNHVYRYDTPNSNKIIDIYDAVTFEHLDLCSFTKDKDGVYYEHKIIDGADPVSFIIKDVNEKFIVYDRNYTYNLKGERMGAFSKPAPSQIETPVVEAINSDIKNNEVLDETIDKSVNDSHVSEEKQEHKQPLSFLESFFNWIKSFF